MTVYILHPPSTHRTSFKNKIVMEHGTLTSKANNTSDMDVVRDKNCVSNPSTMGIHSDWDDVISWTSFSNHICNLKHLY